MRFSLIAAAALLVAIAGYTRISHAQAPPMRAYGSLTIDGRPAPVGTSVTAEVNGRDCGSKVTTTAGQYTVDVLDQGYISGCARPDDPVVFKVGTRYAAEVFPFSGGYFIEANLTISGAATRPAAATPTPTPSPTPSATPTPSPTPTPTSAPPFSVSLLDLNTPCIPEGTQVLCDSARTALWNGDQAAWTARYRAQNQPDPSPDDVFTQTFGFRIEAGDPAAIGAVAQALGWPHLRITGARYRGTQATEGDEWVEIRNLGGASQDMTGWSVRVGDGTTRWTFQEGFTLEGGRTCRFYTGAARDDSCPGSANISLTGVLPNDAGILSLWVDYFDLKAVEVRYSANPIAQPPPPNLQGAQ